MKNEPILRFFQTYLEEDKHFTHKSVMVYLPPVRYLSRFMAERGKNILEVSEQDIEDFAATITNNRDLSPIREFFRFINKKYGIDTEAVMKVLTCGFRGAVRRHHQLGVDNPKLPLSEQALNGCMASILHEFSEYMRASGFHKALIKHFRYYFPLFSKHLADQGKTPLSAGATAINDFLEKSSASYSPKTLGTAAAAIRKFYVFLLEHAGDERVTAPIEIMLETPTGLNIKKNNALPWLSVETMNTLIATPDASQEGIRDAAVMGLGYACGLMPGQIRNIMENDIKIQDNAGYVEFLPTTRRNGKIPMLKKAFGADVAKLCQRYLQEVRPWKACETGCNHLFLSNSGLPLSYIQLALIVKKHAQTAGIKTNFIPGILKNSHIMHLLKCDMPPKIMLKTLGMAYQYETLRSWERSLDSGPII